MLIFLIKQTVRTDLQAQRLEVITRLEGMGSRACATQRHKPNVQTPVFMPLIHTANLSIPF